MPGVINGGPNSTNLKYGAPGGDALTDFVHFALQENQTGSNQVCKSVWISFISSEVAK